MGLESWKRQWASLALLLVLSGCAPALQSNRAELDARANKLRNIVMLAPDIKIYELSAGGLKEQRDEWGSKGKENVERAVIEKLKEKGVTLKSLKVGQDLKDEVDDIKTLYHAVMESVYTYSYYWNGGNPNFFPERLKDFDYSVGSLEKLLKKQNADGLILLRAEDEISSAGRKALETENSSPAPRHRPSHSPLHFGCRPRQTNPLLRAPGTDRRGVGPGDAEMSGPAVLTAAREENEMPPGNNVELLRSTIPSPGRSSAIPKLRPS